MAEKKIINSAVRLDEQVDRGEGKAPGHGTRTFGPGQEEDLAKAANKKQIQHLTDQGAIAGFGAKPTKGSPAEQANVTIFAHEEEAGVGGAGTPVGGSPKSGSTPPAGGAKTGGEAGGLAGGSEGGSPTGGAPAGGTPPAGGTQ